MSRATTQTWLPRSGDRAIGVASMTRSAPAALFVGSIVGSTATPCVLVTGAVAFAGVGAVALVAFFIPGAVCARIAVMPA